MMSVLRATSLVLALTTCVTIAAGGENANKPAGAPAVDPFNWGDAVGGLQLGLVPTGRGDTPERRNVYFEGEGLKFALYLRNAGESDLTLLHAALQLPDFQITVASKSGDKSWTAKYDPARLPKDPAQMSAPVRLCRGSHGNCVVEFDANWRFEGAANGAAAVKALPAGKYTLQVAYNPQLAKTESGWQGKALTGSVDIEVRVKPAPTVGWPGGGGGGGGVGGGGGGGTRPLPRPIPMPLASPQATL
ncbi:MAG TPA: hypothetical protein PK280_05615 [Planctomycetota bacterium]|nr:hypothetical protein [Planctomycetota bacterium]